MTQADGEEAVEGTRSSGRWFLTGARQAISVPALVLMAAFFGFGGFAQESGFTLPQSLLMTASIWAMPSMVVLVGAASSGAGLLAIALAVTLSAVRLMPMTVSLVPILRGRDTPTWKLAFLSHFVAVTAWVEAMRRLPELPRDARAPYFLGFAGFLVAINIVVTAIGHSVSGVLPLVLAAAIFLLTPVYFLLSLTNAAGSEAERIAMALGLVIGPLVYLVLPGMDLLVSGLVAGTIAFLIQRRRKPAR